jgi:hypothetical protein
MYDPKNKDGGPGTGTATISARAPARTKNPSPALLHNMYACTEVHMHCVCVIRYDSSFGRKRAELSITHSSALPNARSLGSGR